LVACAGGAEGGQSFEFLLGKLVLFPVVGVGTAGEGERLQDVFVSLAVILLAREIRLPSEGIFIEPKQDNQGTLVLCMWWCGNKKRSTGNCFWLDSSGLSLRVMPSCALLEMDHVSGDDHE
jgi:hypothetical protein